MGQRIISVIFGLIGLGFILSGFQALFEGLRIFRWTENMETAVPTDHPSDFLVYDADLLSWPVAF